MRGVVGTDRNITLSIGRAALGEVGLGGEAEEAVKAGPDLVRPQPGSRRRRARDDEEVRGQLVQELA